MLKKVWGFTKAVFAIIGVIVIALVALYFCAGKFVKGEGRTTRVVEATPQEVVGLVSAAETDTSENILPELPEETILKASTVERVLSPASELVTLRNSYSGGGQKTDYKKLWGHKVPCTTNQVVYIYEGCVCVGFDIKDVAIDVDNDKKTISITIPEPAIISDELYEDKFCFWDVKNSVFNSSSLAEYSELAAEIKSQEEKEMFEEEGFDEKVRENAKSVFTMLLGVCAETEEYEVMFR